MKKFLAGILAVCLCGGTVCGFTGCDKDEDTDGGDPTVGREVSEKEWNEMLTAVMNADEATSYTLILTTGSTYGKERAEEYGRWSYSSITYQYDKTAQVLYMQKNGEFYNEATSEEEAHFSESDGETYILAYNGGYYQVSSMDNAEKPWLVIEMTKAEFITETELLANSVSGLVETVEVYQPLYSMLEYNDDTGRYAMANVGTMNMEMGFFGEDGIETYMCATSLEYNISKIYNINKTAITVPEEVKLAITKFVQK